MIGYKLYKSDADQLTYFKLKTDGKMQTENQRQQKEQNGIMACFFWKIYYSV